MLLLRFCNSQLALQFLYRVRQYGILLILNITGRGR